MVLPAHSRLNGERVEELLAENWQLCHQASDLPAALYDLPTSLPDRLSLELSHDRITGMIRPGNFLNGPARVV